MRRWISLALAVVLSVLAAAPVKAQVSSFADILTFARDQGRTVVTVDADSTGQSKLRGHGYAGPGAMMRFAQAAGLYMPANATSGNNLMPGMHEARRHKNSGTVGGMLWPSRMLAGGYPAAVEQYGLGSPLVGVGHQTTTLNEGADLSATDVTITVTSAAALLDGPNWIVIENPDDYELVFYASKSGNNLTGCQRGQYSYAAIHPNGTTVRQAKLWNGPAPAYLGGNQLNGLIAAGTGMSGSGTITVDDTSQFTVWPTSAGAGSATITDANRVYMHNGTDFEIFTYTGKTATTLTGVTRAALGTTARDWPDNQPIYQYLSGAIPSGLLYPDHPLGPSTSLKLASWWMSMSASSVNGATIALRLTSQPTELNSDSTRTVITTGSAVNMTGTAIGTIGKTVITGSQADRSSLTLMFGASDDLRQGPFGPAVMMETGLFAATRDKGVVQAMGRDLGSNSLSNMLFYLDRHNVTSGVNPYRLGLVSRNKMFLDAGDADVGGNGNVMRVAIKAFGHNECGTGGGFYGPPDTRAGYSWTIAGISDSAGTYASGDVNITITDTGTLPASNFIVRINDEFIFVPTQSGGVLTGCIRGVLGSVPSEINIFDTVYVGYPTHHPRGFAADVLHDYKMEYDAWIAAGGTAQTFAYVYVRPIPTSASPSTVADDTAVAGGNNDQREYKLNRFTEEIRTRLSGLPGFVVLDSLPDFDSGEPVTFQNGQGTDQIHNEGSFFLTYWTRLAAHYGYGAGAGNEAIGGGSRRGLRGRPRRVVKGGLREKYRVRNRVKARRLA